MGWVMTLATEGNDSGITCHWLLVSACTPMAAVIIALFIWAKAKDVRIEELHKEKDAVSDARLQDFKERYDKLSHRKNSSMSDS